MEPGLERFSRQLLLQGIGPEGVKRLRSSKVTVVGCGALGSAETELLARAGVGAIRVVDRDVVDVTNLHRTHMVSERDAYEGTPKAAACARGVSMIDSSIKVEMVIDDVDSDNVIDLISDSDIVLDGTDNLETRMLINEAAVKLSKPWIYAGVNSWYGTVMLIEPGKGPCLRCLMPSWGGAQESCDVIPTIGTVTTLVASVAAGLAVRYLAGDRPSPGELIVIDGRNMSIEKVSVQRNPDCPVCVHGRFELLSRPASYGISRLCGSRDYKVRLRERIGSAEALAAKLEGRFRSVVARPSWVRVVTSRGQIVTIMPPRLATIEGAASEEEAVEAYNEVAEAAGLERL